MTGRGGGAFNPHPGLHLRFFVLLVKYVPVCTVCTRMYVPYALPGAPGETWTRCWSSGGGGRTGGAPMRRAGPVPGAMPGGRPGGHEGETKVLLSHLKVLFIPSQKMPCTEYKSNP